MKMVAVFVMMFSFIQHAMAAEPQWFSTFSGVSVNAVTDKGFSGPQYHQTNSWSGVKQFSGIKGEVLYHQKNDDKVQAVQVIWHADSSTRSTTSALFEGGQLKSQLNCYDSAGAIASSCRALTPDLCRTILKVSKKKSFDEILKVNEEVCEPLAKLYKNAVELAQDSINQAYVDHGMMAKTLNGDKSLSPSNIKKSLSNFFSGAPSEVSFSSKGVPDASGIRSLDVVQMCKVYADTGVFPSSEALAAKAKADAAVSAATKKTGGSN